MSQQSPNAHPATESDPFDDLMTLEDTLYNAAHTLGTKDGARAGRIEGRIFGLEKGFEKFCAMGVLHGRACAWGARLPVTSPSPAEDTNPSISIEAEEPTQEPQAQEKKSEVEATTTQIQPPTSTTLPLLPPNPRLAKHIATLHALTDPYTFSTANTEESVADFDDRFKRASAKAKIIERTIGESSAGSGGNDVSARSESPKKNAGVRGGVKVSGEKRREENMEDFMGGRAMT